MKGAYLKEMFLLTVVLLLAALPDQSLGQEEEEEEEEEETEISGSGVMPKLQQEIVDKHNEMRRAVDPPARNMVKMVWNETVGESARKWGEACLPKSSPLELRTFDGVLCGQTIYQANFVSTWGEVVDFWSTKKSNFKYGVGQLDPAKSIYSYTQAIWYNSYQVGCGFAHCPQNQYPFMYICQYCPVGNIVELMPTPYKEGPTCGDCPKNCEKKLCTNPCKYLDLITDCGKLKLMVGCKKANKKGQCNATCRCKNKIV